MKSNVISIRGTVDLPKATARTLRTKMDVVLLTPESIRKWATPPFQRDKRVTARVKAVIEELKVNGGFIPGIITLGELKGATFLVDGQHRIEAFIQSGLSEGIADVRMCYFDTLSDMSEEFVRLNSPLVRMRNDDFLRGLEATNPMLAELRRRIPFAGYSNVRMRPTTRAARTLPAKSSKVILMSTALRCWYGSIVFPTAGPSSIECANMLDENEVRRLTHVMTICWEAWGAEPENNRLWGKLNISIVFWLWRRMVLREGLSRGSKTTILTPDQFRLCLMALAANGRYVEWLLGRNLTDRDRPPCYAHMTSIFKGRMGGMGIGRGYVPLADWGAQPRATMGGS